MKHPSWIAVVGAALGSAGCGWYTNIPAQINIKSVEPSSVRIEYKISKADPPLKGIEAKYTQPVVTFAGKPGSIGAVFDTARIQYYGVGAGQAEPKQLGDVAGGPSEFRVYTAIRVESSAMREDYDKGYQEMKDFQDKRLHIGTGKWEAPVVTKHVLELGAPGATDRPGHIFARILLKGKDDAQWPVEKEIVIPITFADVQS